MLFFSAPIHSLLGSVVLVISKKVQSPEGVCPLLNDNTCTDALYWTPENGNSFSSEAFLKFYSLRHYKRNQCGLKPSNQHCSPAQWIETLLLPLLLIVRTVQYKYLFHLSRK